MYYNKKNEKNKIIFKEFNNLVKKYIKTYKEKESLNKFFSENNIIYNKKTKKYIKLNTNDIENYITSYFNTIIQRLIYNKEISKQNNLIPYFVTFTLPSEYHPFVNFRNGKKLKNKQINNKFDFETIDESVKVGYKKLVETFRSFYKQLKDNKYRKQMKKLKYNYFIEYHKSFIPHLHLLIYVPDVENVDKYINKIYLKTLEKNGLNEKGNKLIKIENKTDENGNELNGLDGSVLYISKYISKNLKMIKENKNELRKYWGWKIENNIRIFRGSNTKIGVKGYKKIYYNLNEEEKNKLLSISKGNQSCILLEIEKQTKKHTYIVEESGEIKEKIKYGFNSKKDIKNIQYRIEEVKQKIIKRRYKNVYNIFKTLKYLNIPDDNEIYILSNYENILKQLSEKTKLTEEKIEEYIELMDKFVYYYECKKYTKMDKIVDNLEHKEHILKNIFNKLYYVIDEQIQIIKMFLEDEDEEEFDFYKRLKKVLGEYYTFLNNIKFVNLILNNIKKVSEIFFKIKYRLISYIVYKNDIEIYNNSDYKLIQKNIQYNI